MTTNLVSRSLVDMTAKAEARMSCSQHVDRLLHGSRRAAQSLRLPEEHLVIRPHKVDEETMVDGS